MKRYDIIISGGGMIGAIAANAAIEKGFKVLIIESNKVTDFKEDLNRELRVSAISWINSLYLKQLNVFNHLINSRIHAYHTMAVWDNRSHASIQFDCDNTRASCLGYLIENTNLIHASFSHLNQSESCDIIELNSITALENIGSQVRIKLKDESEYKAKLLIAAEGRQSKVRQLLSINTKEQSYKQKGLVCYIQIEKAPKHTALQAFNQGGPIGILPFGEGLFSIVWSLPEDQISHWLNCNDQVFVSGLKEAIAQDFGQINIVSSRAAFPLTQLYADKYFENRVVLCGDTAHGIHPLAGQGVNLGIGDVHELFNNLDKEVIRDDDTLRLKLRKYQRRRRSKVTETSEMMSFINYLFKDDQLFKKPIRSFALNTLNKMTIKNWFANQAGS